MNQKAAQKIQKASGWIKIVLLHVAHLLLPLRPQSSLQLNDAIIGLRPSISLRTLRSILLLCNV